MDREWREASDVRPSLVGLAVVLGVASVLRFWSLASGIPYAIGADEPEIMTRVVHMMQTGDFNPRFFGNPSLYIYVQLVVACTRFVLGAGSTAWSSVSQVTDADFYLWGRVVTACLGVASVYLVYLIGSRWGARHALLAAGLVAVLPDHVRESHFVLTGVPMTFFTTLSFLLTLRALEKQTAGAFAWAGAVAGLAAATSYYGGVILVAPLLAACLASGAPRPRRLLALVSIGAAAGCFLLAAPYTVLDLPGFLDGVAAGAGALRASAAGVEPGWTVLGRSLKLAFWYSGVLFMIWGLAHAIVRAITGPGKTRFVLLLVFPVASVALFKAHATPVRQFLIPLLPFLALLIAIAIISGVSLLRRFSIPRALRTALIVMLTVVVILPPAVMAIDFDVAFGKPSTRQIAIDWINANIAAGSRVAVEKGGLRFPRDRYVSTQVGRLIDFDYQWYMEKRIQYLIASLPSGDEAQLLPAEEAAYDRFCGQFELLARIDPARGRLGPRLRILKVRTTPAVAPSSSAAAGSVAGGWPATLWRRRSRDR